MASSRANRRVMLTKHFKESDEISGVTLEEALTRLFAVRSLPLEPEGSVSASGSVLVKNLYVSVDPYQMNRFKEYSPSHEAGPYAQRQAIAEVIRAAGIGRVVESGNPNFQKGDIVVGSLGWEEYSVIEPSSSNTFSKITTTEFPLSYHLSVLGSSGLTAYVGFYDVGKPKPGEKVFVSAACGSVGNLVGQYAKLSGCYVVGSAGSKAKVDLLKDVVGFDGSFNYKDEVDLKCTLKRYFPDGIDIYFDNVGGSMLEAVIANMNPFGRIVACGVVAEYTSSDKSKKATPNMVEVIYKRITIQGFLIVDYYGEAYERFINTTSDYLHQGKLQVLEDISQGIEKIPYAFNGLFCGVNVGKKLVQLE